MSYRIWQVALVSLLTSLVGINYTIYAWFDYGFLGIVKGVLLKSLTFWGYASIVIGIMMLVSIALRKVINVKIINTQIEYGMTMTFVMQLPMVSLWFMAIVMSGIEAGIGAILHLSILILIGSLFLTSHLIPRNKRNQSLETLHHE